nr:MAG TPA: hypothetical protein [Caudoviricetes sp.]
MKQQSLFDTLELDETALERKLYDTWEPSIIDACEELGLHSADFSLRKNKGYSSVYFNTNLVARMHIRGKDHYVSIPGSWSDSLPPGIKVLPQKDGRVKIRKADAESPGVVKAIICAMVLHFPKEYDCCSRFEECSDAKQCTNPDRALALGCGYRKILASGKVFYGKNRNI